MHGNKSKLFASLFHLTKTPIPIVFPPRKTSTKEENCNYTSLCVSLFVRSGVYLTPCTNTRTHTQLQSIKTKQTLPEFASRYCRVELRLYWQSTICCSGSSSCCQHSKSGANKRKQKKKTPLQEESENWKNRQTTNPPNPTRQN